MAERGKKIVSEREEEQTQSTATDQAPFIITLTTTICGEGDFFVYESSDTFTLILVIRNYDMSPNDRKFMDKLVGFKMEQNMDNYKSHY